MRESLKVVPAYLYSQDEETVEKVGQDQPSILGSPILRSSLEVMFVHLAWDIKRYWVYFEKLGISLKEKWMWIGEDDGRGLLAKSCNEEINGLGWSVNMSNARLDVL